MSKKAIVMGATGAVGQPLITALVTSGDYTTVTTIGRRVADYPALGQPQYTQETPAESSTVRTQTFGPCTLDQHVVNYNYIERHSEVFAQHDDLFITHGTTQNDAGSTVRLMDRVADVTTLRTGKFLACGSGLRGEHRASGQRSGRATLFRGDIPRRQCEFLLLVVSAHER